MVESRYDSGIIRRCNNSRSHNNTDNASFGPLLEDIFIEILCRLPAKSLIRFKCVSRYWYCLISNVVVPRISPLPVRTFLCSVLHFILVYFPMPNPPQIDDDFNEVMPRCLLYKILLDCCNGLFLFMQPYANQYSLWRGKTCEVVMIPSPRAYREHALAAIVFNPHESVHYKVVRFRHGHRGSPPGVRTLDIFYSETGTWVKYKLHYKPSVDEVDLVEHCINFGDSLYRLSKSGHLLRYDLNEVNVTAINLPHVGGSSTIYDKIGCIGISLGRLHHARLDGSTLLIWMLSDNCGDWVLVRSICFRELAKQHLSIRDFLLESPASSGFEPVSFHPDSAAVFLWIPKTMISYHYSKNEIEAIRHSESFKYPPRVFHYSSCLFPLKNIVSVQ